MFGGEGFSVFSPPDWSGFESAKVFYSGNKIPQIRFWNISSMSVTEGIEYIL